MAEIAMRVSKQRTLEVLLGRCMTTVRKFLSASSQPASSLAAVSKTSKRKKGKNLFEVAQFLPNWGVGFKMAKTHWKGVSYEITKINLYKDGRQGKGWGIVHKDGAPPADAPKKISGVHQRCWKYISDPAKAVETAPKVADVQSLTCRLEAALCCGSCMSYIHVSGSQLW